MALGDYGTASNNVRRTLEVGHTVTYTSSLDGAAKTGVLTVEWLRRPTENRVRAFTVRDNGAGNATEILLESAFTKA